MKFSRKGNTMYRALYRKWRPLTFDAVIGQDDIVAALKNQIIHDKVGHAYIFTGTRGTGKTTCAKVFSKAVNCPNTVGGNPCGTCNVCTGVDDGSLLDVIEIDAASNNGVDSIRDLREETAYTPSQCKYKVYIIDEVHMLSTAAFNALLKTMEEPPAHIIFVLATTEIHKVPATILSRCQRYDFMRITPENIAKRLQYIAGEEKIELTSEAACLISRLADGAMRDALSILDTCAGVTATVDEETVRKMAGVTDKSYLFSMSQAVTQQDAAATIALLAQLREKSVDMKRLTEELIYHYRNLMLAGIGGENGLVTGVSVTEEQQYLQCAKREDVSFCVFAIKRLGECLERMSKGTDQRIELELALFSLCEGPTTAAPVDLAASAAAKPVLAPVQTTAQPAKAVSEKVVLPQTAPADAVPFAQWAEVITAMQDRDKLLYGFMCNSQAYQQGKYVLIAGTDFLFDYIRKNKESSALIKKVIEEVTGEYYNIGPYKLQAETVADKMQAGDEALKHLQELGIPVEYK
ncbi:MAG: DNA polymerase III subunit gamma/tau [Oscillospiraceae bacterium]|nr:DNA polymerase III subunit gamma/tau [Oscillospiraceae bacterium]